MNNKNWRPTNYQKDRLIYCTKKYITQRICDLQSELECPDEFIFDFLKDIQKDWDPNSCKLKAENLQKVNIINKKFKP